MKDAIPTFVLTIMGGVFVFVLGQISLKFFIEPIHELRSHIGKIADALIFYANVYANPGCTAEQEQRNASDELRKLASELMARTAVVPLYGFACLIRALPSLSDIRKAHRALIGLSNNVFRTAEPTLEGEANEKRVADIKAALKLPPELLA